MQATDCAACAISWRRFNYAGLAIGVRSNDPQAVSWLEEFLFPSFDVDSERNCQHQIELVIDDRRFRDLQKESNGCRKSSIECFTLDGEFTECSGWVRRNGERILFDEKFQVFYCVSGDVRRIEMVAAKTSLKYRVALMRVVRELATIHCHSQDKLHMHAASFSRDGHGFFMAGKKRSGKTTLLLHALHTAGNEFVSNDRLFIDLDGVDSVIHGMPTIVHVREPTLDRFAEFTQRYRRESYRHDLRIGEGDRALADGFERDETSLSGRQLCDLLGVQAVPRARLEVMVFPRIEPAVRSFRLMPLPASMAAERLKNSLLSAGSPMRLSSAFTPYGSIAAIDRLALEERCRRIAESVPCIQAELGAHAYRDGRLLDELTNLKSVVHCRAA